MSIREFKKTLAFGMLYGKDQFGADRKEVVKWINQIPIGKSDQAMHLAIHLWMKKSMEFKVGDIVQSIYSRQPFQITEVGLAGTRLKNCIRGVYTNRKGRTLWIHKIQCEMVLKYPDPGPKFSTGDRVRDKHWGRTFTIVRRVSKPNCQTVYYDKGGTPFLENCIEHVVLEGTPYKLKETKMEKTNKAVEWCEKNLSKTHKYLITSLAGKAGLLRYNETTNTWRLLDWGCIRSNGNYDVAEALDFEGCFVREIVPGSPGTSAWLGRITYPEEMVTITVSKKALDEAKALVASGRGDIELSALDGFLSELKEED